MEKGPPQQRHNAVWVLYAPVLLNLTKNSRNAGMHSGNSFLEIYQRIAGYQSAKCLRERSRTNRQATLDSIRDIVSHRFVPSPVLGFSETL